jgi:hypothetical protein
MWRGSGEITTLRSMHPYDGWAAPRDSGRRMKAPTRGGETCSGPAPGKPDVPGGCAFSCRSSLRCRKRAPARTGTAIDVVAYATAHPCGGVILPGVRGALHQRPDLRPMNSLTKPRAPSLEPLSIMDRGSPAPSRGLGQPRVHFGHRPRGAPRGSPGASPSIMDSVPPLGSLRREPTAPVADGLG